MTSSRSTRCERLSSNTSGLARAIGHGSNPAWRVLRIVAIMVLLGAVACSSKDPVSVLMADLEEAAEARDVKGIDKRMASGFSGHDGISREETLSLLRRYFAAYERISLDVTSVELAKAGDRLNFRVDFSGQGKAALGLQDLLPSTAAYQFQLQLVQEGGTLKVNKATWREVPTL